MRDLLPSPLDTAYAVSPLKATMPRNSSGPPPATRNLSHVSPLLIDFRMTPFEPDAHTTRTRTARGFGTALTPRKFVSIPLVCTFHHCPCAQASQGNRSRRAAERRIFAVIARSFGSLLPPDSRRPFRLS